MSQPLSPAAQAVLSAAESAYGYSYSEFYCCADRVAAAALRVAADQVVPEHDCREVDTEEWLGQSAIHQALHFCRFKLLAIAAEIEGREVEQ
jgi:hypothetical protein